MQAVYSFWQYEVCDVFIELIKPVMAEGSAPVQQATRETLCTCLDQGLRYPSLPCLLGLLTSVMSQCFEFGICTLQALCVFHLNHVQLDCQ